MIKAAPQATTAFVLQAVTGSIPQASTAVQGATLTYYSVTNVFR